MAEGCGLPVGKPFVFGKKFLQGKYFSYITICCGCINILVRHYGRLVPPWGVGTTSGYYARTSDSYYLSINFLLCQDQWLLLPFSLHKSNSLRSFPAAGEATISKWQRLLSPIVPFISLIGFIHSPNCSIFRQRFLIQPSVYFTRVDMKYRYLQFAQIWNTILRNAVNCCSARIATLQSNCFQYPG